MALNTCRNGTSCRYPHRPSQPSGPQCIQRRHRHLRKGSQCRRPPARCSSLRRRTAPAGNPVPSVGRAIEAPDLDGGRSKNSHAVGRMMSRHCSTCSIVGGCSLKPEKRHAHLRAVTTDEAGGSTVVLCGLDIRALHSRPACVPRVARCVRAAVRVETSARSPIAGVSRQAFAAVLARAVVCAIQPKELFLASCD